MKPFSKNWSTIFQLEVLRLKTQHFCTRLPLSEATVKTNRMGSTKRTYHKERSFFSNYLVFLQILSSIVIEVSEPFFLILRTEKTQQKTAKPFKAAQKQLQKNPKKQAFTIAQKRL